MNTAIEYTTAEIEIAQSLIAAADEGGTIQKDAMARIAHSSPELHTAMPLAGAFTAITGKPFDIELV